MKLHANAKLSVKRRELLVDRVEVAGWSLAQAAEAAGVTAAPRMWLGRYRGEGRDGLQDRSSAPTLVANRTAERRIGSDRGAAPPADDRWEIAEVLCMAHSTVSGILTKIGMGKLGRLGLEPAPRYERERSSEFSRKRTT